MAAQTAAPAAGASTAPDKYWDMGKIHEVCRVGVQLVHVWRSNSLRYIEKGVPVPLAHDLLPEPDDYIGRLPVWYPDTIKRWARQVGRMLPDGTPRRRTPSGRPTHQRRPI